MIPFSFSWGGGAWGVGSWGSGGPSSPDATARAVGNAGNACTLLRNLTTGGLVLPIQLIRGPAAIAQQHWEALNFFRAEFFGDTRQGLPFYELIAGRTPIEVVNNLYRKALLLVRGTVSIDSMVSVLDPKARILRTTYAATLDDGTILTATDEPYIVTGNAKGRSY